MREVIEYNTQNIKQQEGKYMTLNRKLLLISILLGIFFINSIEIHSDFLDKTTPVIIDIQAEIKKAVDPLYAEALKRSQERIKELPIAITWRGEPIQVVASSVANETLLESDTKGTDNSIPRENSQSGVSGKKVQVNTNTGDFSLRTGCSLTPEQYDAVLTNYNSPAIGTGEHALSECKRTQIDNAYVLGIFIHESTAGTAQQWAGQKGGGNTTANVGNIICAGYPTCFGRFRDYSNDWKLGTTQTFDLLRCYRDGSGEGCNGLWVGGTVSTIDEAITRWAPSSDGNDPNSYAGVVKRLTTEWRSANQTIIAAEEQVVNDIVASFTPNGCPLNDVCFIVQGYNGASHTPTETWGGVDIIDNYDPGYSNTFDHPIYATMDATANVHIDTWPGGNCVLLVNSEFRTTNCHMNSVSVAQGQQVKRGDIIGTVGSTGNSSGPHLHYEIWKNEVNQDPNNYGVMTPLK